MPGGTDAAAEGAAMSRLQVECRALERQNAVLRQLVTIYSRLTGMVLQGADLAAITRLFAGLIGRAVAVLDPALQPLTASAPGAALAESIALDWLPASPHLDQVVTALAEERRPLRIPPLPDAKAGTGRILAPIVVGDEILGYLAILEENGDGEELDLLAVEQAATVYALTLMRQRSAAEVTNRLRSDLLEGLLLAQLGDERDARERAALLGYDSACTYRVLSLTPELPSPSSDGAGPSPPTALALQRRVLDALAEFVAAHTPASIAIARRDEVVVLAPEPPRRQNQQAGPTELGRAAAQYLDRRFPALALTTGIGGTCHQPTDIARSYAQARRAVETARRFGRRGEVVAFEDLGIYRLLYQVADPGELRAFVDQVLGNLLTYDQKHQADFARTLAVYLRNHGSLQDTARELIVHVNTVAYRLQRIQTISGLDLDDAEDRLAAEVALRILDGLGPSGQ